MNFKFPEKPGRRIGMRIAIYLVLVLIAAWWMMRFDKMRQNATKLQGASAPEEAISAGGESGVRLPMILVFAMTEGEVDEVVSEATKRLKGRCWVVKFITGLDFSEVKESFSLRELPTAILFDLDNHELGRFTGEITVEKLAALAAQCQP